MVKWEKCKSEKYRGITIRFHKSWYHIAHNRYVGKSRIYEAWWFYPNGRKGRSDGNLKLEAFEKAKGAIDSYLY